LFTYTDSIIIIIIIIIININNIKGRDDLYPFSHFTIKSELHPTYTVSQILAVTNTRQFTKHMIEMHCCKLKKNKHNRQDKNQTKLKKKQSKRSISQPITRAKFFHVNNCPYLQACLCFVLSGFFFSN